MKRVSDFIQDEIDRLVDEKHKWVERLGFIQTDQFQPAEVLGKENSLQFTRMKIAGYDAVIESIRRVRENVEREEKLSEAS